MTRHLYTGLVVWGLLVAIAAFWTGLHPGAWFFTRMTGLLPPHYGYSAYAVVPLLFLTNGWTRGFAGVVLLLSGNRAAWVGAIAGGAWRHARGPHSAAILLVAMSLGGAAVVGGAMLKPRRDNDSIRVQIWRAALGTAIKHPEGVGTGQWCVGVAGNLTCKAHSDVLQLVVEQGFKATALVLLVLGWAFYRLPEGPGKALVVALSVQSVIDNRLHHPACAALYAAAWLAASRSGRPSAPTP